MKLEKVIEEMKSCWQIEGKQSVWEHGDSVQRNIRTIYSFLKDDCPIPDGFDVPSWLFDYKNEILENLYPLDLLERYALFHDCGKPFCRIKDDEG